MSCSRSFGKWRQIGLFLTALFALAFPVLNAAAQTAAATPSTNAPAARKPCIILIVADGIGYGDLGCYGQTKIKTTNLDQLAAEGMRFTSFYAGDTLSPASRTSLLTGLHTGHARTRGAAAVAIGGGDTTVAEVLKMNGYRNCAIGTWGLGNRGSSGEPRMKGFDEWFGYLTDADAQNYYPALLNRSREGEEHDVGVTLNLNGKRGKYSDDYFTEAALNFINYSKPEEYTSFRPFFLYLAYTMPHPNFELAKATGNGLEVPNDAPYSSSGWTQPEKNKAAMITRLDDYVGQIMTKLKALKMDNNTIVIFTSVNGPYKEGGADPSFFASTGALRGNRGDLYEGGIRVPMIVRWPVRVRAGQVSDAPFAFWDFLPTAVDIAGAPERKDTDGISFLPTLVGQKQTKQHDFLYWEVHDQGFKQAVRMGDWKAVRTSAEGPLELYNLKTDPGEKMDVADKKVDVIGRIQQYLKTARTDDPNWPIQKSPDAAKSDGK